jgi:hypothetical protein
MASAQAFAQGAAPSPEAFPRTQLLRPSQPVTGRTVMQSGPLKLHEGRASAFVPFSGGYSVDTTDTSREGLVHAN